MVKNEPISAADWIIRFGGASNVGKVRERNEDSFLVLVRSDPSISPERQLPPDCPFDAVFAVADGMGGETRGINASYAVILAIRKRLTGDEVNRIAAQNQVDPRNLPMLIRRLIEDLIPEVNTTGGGSTLTLLATRGNEWCVAFLGDSRAYVWNIKHKAPPRQLTEDHKHSQRGGLLNGLGSRFTSPKVCLQQGILQPGDLFYLQTDGANALGAAFFTAYHGRSDMEAAAREAVTKAVRADGKDNATIVLAQFVGSDDTQDTSLPVAGDTTPSKSESPLSRRRPASSHRWILISLAGGLGILAAAVALFFLSRQIKPAKTGTGFQLAEKPSSLLTNGIERPVRRFRVYNGTQARSLESRAILSSSKTDGDYLEFSLVGGWGVASIVALQRGDIQEKKPIVFPEATIKKAELFIHPASTLAFAPRIRLTLSPGVECACDGRSVQQISNGVFEITSKWGDTGAISYGNRDGKQYQARFKIAPIGAIQRGIPDQMTLNGNPLLVSLQSPVAFQSVAYALSNAIARGEWDPDRQRAWSSVSCNPLPEVTSPLKPAAPPPAEAVANKNSKPYMPSLTMVRSGDGPGWPSINVEGLGSDDTLVWRHDNQSQRLQAGVNALVGLPWGETVEIVISNSQGGVFPTNLVALPPGGLAALCPLPELDYDAAANQVNKWQPYLTAAFVSELRQKAEKIKPAINSQWKPQSELILIVKRGPQPRWPVVQVKPSGTDEMIECNLNGIWQKIPGETELSQTKWGSTLEYRVEKKGCSRQPKSLSLKVTNIVTLCGLDQWSECYTNKDYLDGLKQWHKDYLAELPLQDFEDRLHASALKTVQAMSGNRPDIATLQAFWGLRSCMKDKWMDVKSEIEAIITRYLLADASVKEKNEKGISEWLGEWDEFSKTFEGITLAGVREKKTELTKKLEQFKKPKPPPRSRNIVINP